MPRHIAIVEDEPAIRQNYMDAFRHYGWRASGYADRSSALKIFRNQLPDLVIIDVGLGDEIEGGFDLCRELRALSRTLPIIFLTARDTDLDVISGLRLGADVAAHVRPRAGISASRRGAGRHEPIPGVLRARRRRRRRRGVVIGNSIRSPS